MHLPTAKLIMKMHKLVPKARPVVACGAIGVNMFTVLVQLILAARIPQSSARVDDPKDVAEAIRGFKADGKQPFAILIDIVAMFPALHVEDILATARSAGCTSSEMEFLEAILAMSFFTIGGEVYRQNSGIFIGFGGSCDLAQLVMCPMDNEAGAVDALHLRWMDDIPVLTTKPEVADKVRNCYTTYETTIEDCTHGGGVSGVFAGVRFHVTRTQSEAYAWVRPEKRHHWLCPAVGHDKSACANTAAGLLIAILRCSPKDTWPPGATATSLLLRRHGYSEADVSTAIHRAGRVAWRDNDHSKERRRPTPFPVPFWATKDQVDKLRVLWGGVLAAQGVEPNLGRHVRTIATLGGHSRTVDSWWR